MSTTSSKSDTHITRGFSRDFGKRTRDDNLSSPNSLNPSSDSNPITSTEAQKKRDRFLNITTGRHITIDKPSKNPDGRNPSQEGDASAANILGGKAIVGDSGDSDLETQKPKPTSQYITAQRALTHISTFELPLHMAFADVRFKGDYKVQVGFNESMLQRGVLVEELYLLLEGSLQVSEDEVCVAFTPVFAPFPGTIYTQDKTYYLPVDPQDQVVHPFPPLSTMSGANGSRSALGGGGEDVGSGRDQNNGGGNSRQSNQENQNGGAGPGDSGGSGSDDEDDHDNSNNDPSGIPGSARKGKGVQHGTQNVDIPFCSRLFINTPDWQVTTSAGIRITFNNNERGMFPPPDVAWGGPWLKVDMTWLEVSSKFDDSAYLLSLAQVQITVCSSDKQAGILEHSSLPVENFVKTTNTKNRSCSIAALFGLNPSGQTQVARWDISSRECSGKEMPMQVDDEAEGALWRYNHNDAVFGRTKNWTFDTEHGPSALFAFGNAKPQVQVQVLVFWSSESGIDKGFPYRWRRVKEQRSVFANFIHRLAVVVNTNDLKEKYSWSTPDKRVDNVTMEELSASKGPIHLELGTATAFTHSTDLKVLITRAVEGRAQLTPTAITDTISKELKCY